MELQSKYGKINIIGYEEARDVIKSLAAQYSDDFSIISRKGKKTAYMHYPCSFDIETTTIKPGMFNYVNEDGRPVAFPYLFQFNIWGTVIFARTYDECMDIFGWIAEFFELGEHKKLIMFVHNLGYEYGFFKDLWEIVGEDSFALDEHHPVTIALTSGIIIRDSYKMTGMSLETLSKDWAHKWKKDKEIMDYGKIRTPYTDIDDDTAVYSALDVLSLSDSIQNYLYARHEEIWTECPTSTSFIRKNLKKAVGVGVKKRTAEQKAYFRTLEKLKMDEKQYKLLKEVARGGNTHANRAYTGHILHDLVHKDITSSYPAQMVCYKEYPLGPIIDTSDLQIEEILDMNDLYCTWAKICLINPTLKKGVTVPYIPTAICSSIKGHPEYSDNGRYLGGSEQLVISVFSIEIPLILKQYDVEDILVLESYSSLKGYLPDIIRRFVLDLYAQKTELKGIDDKKVEYALAKTYVNGIYGMAYTDPVRESYKFTKEGIFKDIQDKKIEERLDNYQRSTSYFLPYAWGAMTACLGRIYLQKMIDAVGDSFVYGDTDSIFALHWRKSDRQIKELEKKITEEQRKCGMELVYYDVKGRPHELGGIDTEPFCEEFRTWGAKKYVTKENGKLHSTIAGVPKAEGVKVIGKIDNFKIGLNFPGEKTGKLGVFYNDYDKNIDLRDEHGRHIDCFSNVALLPCGYLLGLSDDYKTCLYFEGVNPKVWMFEDMEGL